MQKIQTSQVCMIQPKNLYDTEFSLLQEYHKDHYRHMLKVPNSTYIDEKGNNKVVVVEVVTTWL